MFYLASRSFQFFRSSRKTFLRQTCIYLSILLSMALQCDATQRNIEEILVLQNKGDFYRAMERFQILRQKNPENPRIPIYLGHLLTLEPLGLGTGIQLMNQGLIAEDLPEKDRQFLCEEIYYLYVSLRQNDYLTMEPFQTICVVSTINKNSSPSSEKYKKEIFLGIRSLNFSSQRIRRQLEILKKNSQQDVKQKNESEKKNENVSQTRRQQEAYYLILSFILSIGKDSHKRSLQTYQKSWQPLVIETLLQSSKISELTISGENKCKLWQLADSQINRRFPQKELSSVAELSPVNSSLQTVAQTETPKLPKWRILQNRNLNRCRQIFPGLIALHRTLPKSTPKKNSRRDNLRNGNLLFDDTYEKVFHSWLPDWKNNGQNYKKTSDSENVETKTQEE